MATRQIITSFPDEIDRNHFGSWLSGLTDGEGCFYLGMHGKFHTPWLAFYIALRSDDSDVLRLIQSYLGCGAVDPKIHKASIGVPNQQTVYRATRPLDRQKIVDHFDAYPLLAKKKRDFQIWKVASGLASNVFFRKSKRRIGIRGGTIPKWKECEIEQFLSLRAELKHVRTFSETILEPNIPKIVQEHFPLFDALEY